MFSFPWPAVTPFDFALALVAVFVGSVIQASVGFGVAIVAAPLLLLRNHAFVPGPLLVVATMLTWFVSRRERESLVVREVAIATLGRISTTIPTALMLASLDERMFKVVFALAVLVAVGISLGGVRWPLTTVTLLIAAAISGVAGTVASIGGPPMALVYQNQSGPHARATLSGIFLIGSPISIASLWWVGHFGWAELLLGVAMFPAVLLGYTVSGYVVRNMPLGIVRTGALTISAFAAAVTLWQAW